MSARRHFHFGPPQKVGSYTGKRNPGTSLKAGHYKGTERAASEGGPYKGEEGLGRSRCGGWDPWPGRRRRGRPREWEWKDCCAKAAAARTKAHGCRRPGGIRRQKERRR